MPGVRFHLTGKDKEALKLFFTERTYKNNSPYLKLADTWKSTTKICDELEESWQRTQRRLQKLSGFGFLDLEAVKNKERHDHYWYINREGIYYILSTHKN